VKLGELFLLGYEPGSFNSIKEFALCQGLGGVIIFERNLASREKLRAEIEDLCQAAGSNIIVAIDQEGGQVNRLKKNVPVFPSMHNYGLKNDIEGLRLFARTTAKYLCEYSINTNLVPVCDVLTNPDNHLMKSRSFGSRPDLVKRLSELVIKEFKRHYILSCAKHFPGLGSAQIDPHKATAMTEISKDEFDNDHWMPFRAAIDSDVDLIMTTHLLAKNLDPNNMATFSSIIVGEFLRKILGYKGVIVTDDLCMGGVASDFTPEQCAVKSLQAGHDLIMFCHKPDDRLKAFEAVAKAYDEGGLDIGKIENSIQLIQNLKKRIGYEFL